ncbi:hypothetical protein ACW9IB_11020 [Pseudomonas sp. SDO524_S393]
MSQEGEGLAGGESSIDEALLSRYLTKEVWRYKWEQGLAKLALGLILSFYALLVGFIFLGNGRIVIGKWYFLISFKSHEVTDLPIILALASIPTILLIALLRYFHYRDKPSDSQESLLPPSLQTAKDVMDMLNK